MENSSDVEKLSRWESAGGTLRILDLSPTRALVELRSCSGEPMERFSSCEQTLIEYLRSRVLVGEVESSTEPTGPSGEH